MNVTPVDERDSSWEDARPRFRVYLFEESPPVYSVETYDITDADVVEVIRWAQNCAGGAKLWSVALVRDTRPQGGEGRGLVWLVGCDANSTPRNGHETRMLDQMISRRGRSVVNDA